jgi:hypothetical protein
VLDEVLDAKELVALRRTLVDRFRAHDASPAGSGAANFEWRPISSSAKWHAEV